MKPYLVCLIDKKITHALEIIREAVVTYNLADPDPRATIQSHQYIANHANICRGLYQDNAGEALDIIHNRLPKQLTPKQVQLMNIELLIF